MSEFIAGIHNQNNIRGSALDYRHINTSNCFLTTEQLLKHIFSCLHTNIKCHLTFCRVSETSAWAQRYDIRSTESFEFLEEQLEAVRGPHYAFMPCLGNETEPRVSISDDVDFCAGYISIDYSDILEPYSSCRCLHEDSCIHVCVCACVCAIKM